MPNAVYSRLKEAFVLPSPQGVALQILKLANDERTTVMEIASVVERDVATAARLLKYANSPLSGMCRQIASTSQAISLLGFQTVKSIALCFSLISQTRRGPCKRFNYERFWSDSIARATAARQVAHQLGTLAPDEVFTAGLLSKIGSPVFAAAFPGTYSDILRLAKGRDPIRRIEIEREKYGLDHNELASEMMNDWRLPGFVCLAVRFQDSPGHEKLAADSKAAQLANVLHLAGGVSGILNHHSVARETLSVTNLEANRLGVKPDVFPQVFDSIAEEWPIMAALFNLPTQRSLTWGERITHATR